MTDAVEYWSPLCRLQSQLHCWVRLVSKVEGSTQEGHWGQLLIIPTEGYLEGPGGPIPFRDVECVDLSTCHVKGGIAGRPLELLDVKDAILAGLRETSVRWELCESMWSVARVFEDKPVQIIRVANAAGLM